MCSRQASNSSQEESRSRPFLETAVLAASVANSCAAVPPSTVAGGDVEVYGTLLGEEEGESPAP